MRLLIASTLFITVAAISSQEILDEIDWREKGAVTKVKDQGSCKGSFYFAAVGVLESYYYLSTGETVDLSEQYCVDCSAGFNGGCDGGAVLNTFAFIRGKGITFEESYPYEGSQKECHVKDNSDIILSSIGYKMLTKGNEEELKTTVATIGPVAVTFKGENLTSYSGGILKDCSSSTEGYSGVIVGYDLTDDGDEYWIVKMSFGSSWGEDGYIRIARNEGNMCGIADTAIYPIIE